MKRERWPARRPPTLELVGAGAAASAIAKAASAAGLRVRVWARRKASARALVRRLGPPAEFVAERADLGRGDWLWLCVSDTSLTGLAAELAAELGPGRRRIVLHASGFHTADVLQPLRQRGFRVGSLHPLLSFPRGARSVDFRGALCAAEGDPGALRAARVLAKRLSAETLVLRGHEKANYHAAAAMLAGGLVVLLEGAEQILLPKIGRKALVRRGFQRLAASVLENVAQLGPRAALSGPAKRGDRQMLRAHEQCLRQAAPDWSRLQRNLVRHMLRLAGQTDQGARSGR